MKTSLPYLFIFSVFVTTRTTQANEALHDKVLQDLQSEGFIVGEAYGYYNGVKEISLVMLTPDNSQQTIERYENVARALSLKYAQECYLVADNERRASLVLPGTGDKKAVGQFQELASVIGLPSYTTFNGRNYGTIH